MQTEDKARADWWQRVLTIATIAIAVVGAIATCVYNEQQTRLQEIELVEKFFPHLISDDPRDRAMAVEVLPHLTTPELAKKLKVASLAARIDNAATIKPEEVKPRPKAADKHEGWAYLGNYLMSDKVWHTRYFKFADNTAPEMLSDKLIVASAALNVRAGMPTSDGSFVEVIDVLKQGDEVTVLEKKPWQMTGFWWAKIKY